METATLSYKTCLQFFFSSSKAAIDDSNGRLHPYIYLGLLSDGNVLCQMQQAMPICISAEILDLRGPIFREGLRLYLADRFQD